MEQCVHVYGHGPGYGLGRDESGARSEKEGERGEIKRERDRTGGTSQENDVDPGRYLSSAARCTVEIAPSSGPVSLYIDIRVSPTPPLLSVRPTPPIVRYLATTHGIRLEKVQTFGQRTNTLSLSLSFFSFNAICLERDRN